MSPFATALLACVLVGNTVGQMLFKAASLRSSALDAKASYWRQLTSQWVLWLAIAIYIVEFFLWLAFLSVVPLWQGVMVASIDILAVMAAGRVFFGERITPARLVAVSLIAVGVGLAGWGGSSV